MFDDHDALAEFFDYNAFLALAEAFQPCPVCEVGFLIQSSQEPNAELVCDVCDARLTTDEE